MKKRYIIMVLALLLAAPGVFNWCMRWYYASAYRDVEDYVTATGTVTHIADSDEWGLFLGIEDTTVTFSDVNFVFKGENRRIVLEKGILEKLQIGDRVEFTVDPWYAGDGYSMPIVAVCVDGEWMLEFEEGYQNLQDHYLKAE